MRQAARRYGLLDEVFAAARDYINLDAGDEDALAKGWDVLCDHVEAVREFDEASTSHEH
jgi:hypothetical protein